MTKLLTNNLGFPRIGNNRELKKATEAYWRGDIDSKRLMDVAAEIRSRNWALQKKAGIDLIPSNDFSLYDQVLDTACMFGAVPERFARDNEHAIDIDLYFRMARGVQEKETTKGNNPHALEMTKWFDTNYHYLVPEFYSGMEFKISWNKPVEEFKEGLDLGIKTKPVLLGPVSFLLLGKSIENNFSPILLLDKILPVYIELLKELARAGADWVQIDEPVMALDLEDDALEAIGRAYKLIAKQVPNQKLLLTFYFGPLGLNLKTALQLPVSGFHFDLIRGKSDTELLLDNIPEKAVISLGLINGRGIWRNNLSESKNVLDKFVSRIGEERLMVGPSCSLMHLPITVKEEGNLGKDIMPMLVFAEEKLEELCLLSTISKERADEILAANQNIIDVWSRNPEANNPSVMKRLERILTNGLSRRNPFSVRREKQKIRFNLPLFPTTTIGSFPQTSEVRAMRRKYKKGELTPEQYDTYVKKEIKNAVRMQEELGIDVLVHGEFERNDMVEFFGEMLSGFVVTQAGWVQSYGTRYVKPPIIYGDVSRPEPMTVEIIKYADSLTNKPLKAMLTGPVTILQWSFCREDISREIIAKQIALAIRDEVRDLESAGIQMIQIDEPALREGLPLRKKDWDSYLEWAVQAFHISSDVIKDETQIHTHMCYSEFNDIMANIAALDADVISIETSRSHMELLNAFKDFRYPNEIGPGVYDIHSPHIPSTEEIEALIIKAATYIPKENLWVNPDCGLKTRRNEELVDALQNMVAAANNLRAKI